MARSWGWISKEGYSILHVLLDVPAEELHRRIDAQVLVENNLEADAEARELRHQNVERCIAAREELSADTVVVRGAAHSRCLREIVAAPR